MKKYFNRLADVEGIGYESTFEGDATQIPGYGARLNRDEDWVGGTNWQNCHHSPVEVNARQLLSNRPLEDNYRLLSKALEVPGFLSCYFEAICFFLHDCSVKKCQPTKAWNSVPSLAMVAMKLGKKLRRYKYSDEMLETFLSKCDFVIEMFAHEGNLETALAMSKPMKSLGVDIETEDFNSRLESFKKEVPYSVEQFVSQKQEPEVPLPEDFEKVDEVVQWVSGKLLSGQPVLEACVESGNSEYQIKSQHWSSLPEARLSFLHLPKHLKQFIDKTFSNEALQRNGCWYLSDKETLNCGIINLPAYYRSFPDIAMNLCVSERYRVSMKNSGEAIFIWAFLLPHFEEALLPLMLRGFLSGSPDLSDSIWQEVDFSMSKYGLHENPEYQRLRKGKQWLGLDDDERLRAKLEFVDAVLSKMKLQPGSLRSWQSDRLRERFYEKTDTSGKPRRNSVVTKEYQKDLAGSFAGNWVEFLRWISEEPHPEDQAIGELPSPQIRVSGSEKAAAVAAKLGINEAEVAAVLGANWEGKQSPVMSRLDVMKRYWDEFHQLHLNQTADKDSLHGLLVYSPWPQFLPPRIEKITSKEDWEESFKHRVEQFPEKAEELAWEKHRDRMIQERELVARCVTNHKAISRFSPALLQEIDKFWGAEVISTHAQKIVPAQSAQVNFRKAFGSALEFWQSIAVRYWFLCDGVRFDDEEAYLTFSTPDPKHNAVRAGAKWRKELKLLDEIKCPIDPEFLKILAERESKMSTLRSNGKRDGFVEFNKIVSEFREAWAERFLGSYLESRWKQDLSGFSRAYEKKNADRGQPPTWRMIIKPLGTAANSWFGGNISETYQSVSLKSPISQSVDCDLAMDRHVICLTTFERLRSRIRKAVARKNFRQEDKDWDPNEKFVPETVKAMEAEPAANMAKGALKFIQQTRARGKRPTMKQFGYKTSLETLANVCEISVEDAWQLFCEVVEAASRAQTADEEPES